MPRRPLPMIPRGRKRKRELPRQVVVACPKICPAWQLQAVRALIKPQFKDAIAHRDSRQRFDVHDRRRLQSTWRDLQLRVEALHLSLPELHFPPDGEFWFIAAFERSEIGLAKKLALALSSALPGRWLTVSNLLARDGQIYRRYGLRKLQLAPLTNLRLSAHLQRA